MSASVLTTYVLLLQDFHRTNLKEAADVVAGFHSDFRTIESYDKS